MDWRDKRMTLPDLPTTVGKEGKNRLADGSEHRFEVVGEIRRTQSDLPSKILMLQKVRFEDGAEELRLGYYIIGKKGRMKGRWTWGQFAPFVPAEDWDEVNRFALFREREGSR
jgi:hypothetical protein